MLSSTELSEIYKAIAVLNAFDIHRFIDNQELRRQAVGVAERIFSAYEKQKLRKHVSKTGHQAGMCSTSKRRSLRPAKFPLPPPASVPSTKKDISPTVVDELRKDPKTVSNIEELTSSMDNTYSQILEWGYDRFASDFKAFLGFDSCVKSVEERAQHKSFQENCITNLAYLCGTRWLHEDFMRWKTENPRPVRSRNGKDANVKAYAEHKLGFKDQRKCKRMEAALRLGGKSQTSPGLIILACASYRLLERLSETDFCEIKALHSSSDIWKPEMIECEERCYSLYKKKADEESLMRLHKDGILAWIHEGTVQPMHGTVLGDQDVDLMHQNDDEITVSNSDQSFDGPPNPIPPDPYFYGLPDLNGDQSFDEPPNSIPPNPCFYGLLDLNDDQSFNGPPNLIPPESQFIPLPEYQPFTPLFHDVLAYNTQVRVLCSTDLGIESQRSVLESF